MREWEEATWRTGQTEDAVMRQAGRSVAAVAERMTKPGQAVLVLAGKGHNGDDAIFAAEALQGMVSSSGPRSVQVLRVSDPQTALVELESLLARKPALVIDGLFGIGLNRPLAGPWPKFLDRVNTSNVPVLAVDVPSGLNAETGLPMPEAIRACTTVTLGAIKAGLVKSSAWPFVGRLEVAQEIGLVQCPFSSELNFTMAPDFTGFPPRRPIAGHKGTFGHVAILAGSLGYHGAAVIASRGAQRAQPGLITVVTAPDTYLPVASQCQAVMVRPCADPMQLPDTCTALLAGPGLAAPGLSGGIKDFIARAWREMNMPVIIDASALPWIPSGPVTATAPRIITPHPGEAARLLGATSADVQNDRPGAVKRLSQQFGDALVVLKGHQTVVGRSKGPLFINSTGNPCLGQGGTGDLLAGYIAGLLAQPALQHDPLLTTRFAVWRHGAAADRLEQRRNNWIVEELALEMAAAF